MDENIECLVIRTGMGFYRFDDKYWNDNYGFDTGVASYLRKKFPHLRVLGFDLISLSCVHRRETGRIVHREFFENGILPLEDMDLRQLNDRLYRDHDSLSFACNGDRSGPRHGIRKNNIEIE